MLIDFTVSNFRSIRDPVTLSLVEVAPRKHRQKGGDRKRRLRTDEEIAPALDLPGWDFKLLRGAAIFGANASGKSNVVRALIALLDLLRNGPEGYEFRYSMHAFRLDPACVAQPTHFDMRFATVVDDVAVVVTYRIALFGYKVVTERLALELPQETVTLVERGVDANGQRHATMDGRVPAGMQELEANLDPEVPFVHMLVRNFELPGLSVMRNWLRNTDGYSAESHFVGSVVTRFWLEGGRDFADAVASFVRDHDTMVDGLRVEKREGERNSRILALHRVGEVEVAWDLAEESAGTRRLIDFAGPILNALRSGSLLVIDEFGANLHPHLTERIVQLFQSPQTNPNGAQLLFNTHDSRLLEGQKLRRDQIWFTEKRADGHTELFALNEFRMRNDAAIDKAYLNGTLGAVPVLKAPPMAREAR